MGFSVPATFLKMKNGKIECSPLAYLMRSSDNVLSVACVEDMSHKKMTATFKKWLKLVLVHEFTITPEDGKAATFTTTLDHYWKEPNTIPSARGYGVDAKAFNRRKTSKTEDGTVRGKHTTNGLWLVSVKDGEAAPRSKWLRVEPAAKGAAR